MQRIIVAGVFALANIVGPAMADVCSAAGHTGDLTGTAIITLLSPGTGTVYACYNPGSRRENNETLLTGGTTLPVSGNFQEYHTGGTTVELEGTYTITNNATNGGLITYVYKSGGTYAYRICSDNVGTTYHYINNSTNAVLNIVITASPGAC
jgi:hypothetical protein